MQMNYTSYLVNELEKDCREAQDQGYNFHFSWLLILIAFVAWQMSEGAAFPEVEPSESLAARFATLWYTNDMAKQQVEAAQAKLETFEAEFPRLE
jgi:hypothetical protein